MSIGGSVVECSPATRAARVRFPADATFVFSWNIVTQLNEFDRHIYKFDKTDEIGDFYKLFNQLDRS